MTRDERAKLKVLDEQILRCCLPLQTLLQERAAIHYQSTEVFIVGIANNLRQIVAVKKEKSK